MSEENKVDCTIGLSENKEVCVITIPIKAYAEDLTNGNKLIKGSMWEIEMHVFRLAEMLRKQKAALGIVKANGQITMNIS